MKTMCGTGHRPDKVGGYSKSAQDVLVRVARKALEQLKPDDLISGMAQGWDQALALAAVDLNIRLVCAIPCDGQDRLWPKEAQRQYADLILKAGVVKLVCPGPYAAYKLHVRNIWMVDHSIAVIALFDGSSGGTKNCVTYAKRQKKPIHNFWETYLDETKK